MNISVGFARVSMPSSMPSRAESRDLKTKNKNTIYMSDKKKTMIYDIDEWLAPYKDVIDRRNKMILELKERYSVDGSCTQAFM